MANNRRSLNFLRGPWMGGSSANVENSDAQTNASSSEVSRRRRNLSLREAALNPHATDFVPNPRTSSKRKASSSAKSGKATGTVSISADSSSTNVAHDPVIKATELFASLGTATNSTNFTPAEISTEEVHVHPIDSDDDDDDEMPDALDDLFREGRNLDFLAGLEAMAKGKRSVKRIETDDRTVTSAMLYTTSSPRHGTNDGSSTSLAWTNYLPLVLTGPSRAANEPKLFKILQSCRRQMDARLDYWPFDQLVWPTNELPMEIFELITEYLPQDDVKAMRLVNKEFESKVSPSLFRSAVVPFNTELYDMIDEDTRSGVRGAPKRDKGKGRARDLPAQLDGSSEGMRLHWKNARDDAEDKVYRGHGLRVFQGFGPHIRRFGMSFEVSEAQLNLPPEKKELDEVDSYHGKYGWPPQHYARFANLAGLENTADETSRMVSAFSKLVNVQELGLSIDSGLGRLNGLDTSIHSVVFSRPQAIFNDPDGIYHRHASGASDFWSGLKRSYASNGSASIQFKEQSLRRKSVIGGMSAMPGLRDSLYNNPGLWPTAQIRNATREPSGTPEGLSFGVLSTTPDCLGTGDVLTAASVSSLRREQKEWLLETEWAQRAFLESYILAVVDNRAVFQGVNVLNLAKIPSGLLTILERDTFWNALPNLESVTVCVHPDWRSVSRDSAGYAETTSISPANAAGRFHHLIATQIAHLKAVKKLRIGYTDGGEHAQGLFARNVNVMPAPVITFGHNTLAVPTLCLRFPYLEELELYNCWITPPALELLVQQHAGLSLKSLTLDSVSLTAHPRNAHNNGGAAGVGQQAAALIAANMPPAQAHNAAFLQNLLGAMPGGQAQAVPANQGQPAPNNYQAAWANFQAPPLAAPAPAPNASIPFNSNPAHWANNAPAGSWSQVLDAISPGPRLADYLAQPQPWEDPLPDRPASALKKLTLKSCGYVRLNSNYFDQSLFDTLLAHQNLTAWFKQRQSALAPHVMTSRDGYLGKIVQALPAGEFNTLMFGWGLREGWDDAIMAEGPEFDGLAPGGRGRVSGVIEKGMALVGSGYGMT